MKVILEGSKTLQEQQAERIAELDRALQKAFQFGQTYWQQADSESFSQNKKSYETLERFRQFAIDTIDALAKQPARSIESEEFYNLCQTYRHIPEFLPGLGTTNFAIEAYQALINYINRWAADQQPYMSVQEQWVGKLEQAEEVCPIQ